jgi:hypothetical protein
MGRGAPRAGKRLLMSAFTHSSAHQYIDLGSLSEVQDCLYYLCHTLSIHTVRVRLGLETKRQAISNIKVARNLISCRQRGGRHGISLSKMINCLRIAGTCNPTLTHERNRLAELNTSRWRVGIVPQLISIRKSGRVSVSNPISQLSSPSLSRIIPSASPTWSLCVKVVPSSTEYATYLHSFINHA